MVPCVTPEDPERVYEILVGLVGGGEEMRVIKEGEKEKEEEEKETEVMGEGKKEK